jgi:predicted ABC-type ATPase
MSEFYPKLVESNHYHLWTDALHDRKFYPPDFKQMGPRCLCAMDNNEFLPIEAECLNFINADLIAQGLSPFQPNKMAIEAERLMIQNINECVKKSESFAFETTLSGKGYINKISNWKTKQYEIIIYYLKVPTVKFAIRNLKTQK